MTTPLDNPVRGGDISASPKTGAVQLASQAGLETAAQRGSLDLKRTPFMHHDQCSCETPRRSDPREWRLSTPICAAANARQRHATASQQTCSHRGSCPIDFTNERVRNRPWSRYPFVKGQTLESMDPMLCTVRAGPSRPAKPSKYSAARSLRKPRPLPRRHPSSHALPCWPRHYSKQPACRPMQVPITNASRASTLLRVGQTLSLGQLFRGFQSILDAHGFDLRPAGGTRRVAEESVTS